MKLKKPILIYSLFIVPVIIAMALFYTFRSSSDSVGRTKPDFSLNAEDLVSSFEEDEASANALYLDKILRVEGIISEIDSNQQGKTIIYIEGNMMSNISCLFSEDTLLESNISIGDEIVVKGKCTGYILDVVLTKCTLVK